MGRKSKAVERRSQITEAMYRCICKYGLHGSTIKKVAEEAGVQPGLLHHYFKDRSEIIEELIEKLTDEVAAKGEAQLNPKHSSEKQFNTMINFLFGKEAINEDQIHFFYNCWAVAKFNTKISRSFTKMYRRFRSTVREHFTNMGMTADLSSEETEDLASMVVAIQDGIDIQWDLDKEKVNLKRMSQLTKDLIELYIQSKKTARS